MNHTVKSWSPSDQPREKLWQAGARALSDSELLAILIGTGTKSHSVVDLSRQLMATFQHDFSAVARVTQQELTQINGLGKAKIARILAAIEIGRRARLNLHTRPAYVVGSQIAFEVIYPHLGELRVEEFWVILLNRANLVLGCQKISQGGVSGTVADPKLIFHQAITQLASGIILAHNHPSGNLKPSQADLDLTRKLVTAGKLLELPILDHLIIAGDNYFSFADEGLMTS